jgi:hypothetical protein
MKRFMNKKVAAIAAAAGLALGIGGAAFAYFTDTGTGTGSGSVGQPHTWGVVAGSETGTIYPGQGSETIPFTITNGGSGNQALQTISAVVNSNTSGDITSGGTDVPGCLATWFTATAGTPTTPLLTPIPAGQQAEDTVTVTMSDAPVPQNACAGATPDITLNVT